MKLPICVIVEEYLPREVKEAQWRVDVSMKFTQAELDRLWRLSFGSVCLVCLLFGVWLGCMAY